MGTAQHLHGEEWAQRQRKKDIFDERFLRQLHKRMFGDTWRWAGEFRRSDKNIGVDWRRIDVDLRNLFDDVRYQLAHNTFPADEIAIRFHHRLVAIHPFRNGNGRHARLMADLLIQRLGEPRFTWGSQGLVEESATRNQCIAALRAADAHDYAPLLAFTRS